RSSMPSIRCSVAKAPTPKKAAWPKDRSPAWPISRLNAIANSDAMSMLVMAFCQPIPRNGGTATSTARTTAMAATRARTAPTPAVPLAHEPRRPHQQDDEHQQEGNRAGDRGQAQREEA